jgi:hypothetical protein
MWWDESATPRRTSSRVSVWLYISPLLISSCLFARASVGAWLYVSPLLISHRSCVCFSPPHGVFCLAYRIIRRVVHVTTSHLSSFARSCASPAHDTAHHPSRCVSAWLCLSPLLVSLRSCVCVPVLLHLLSCSIMRLRCGRMCEDGCRHDEALR